MNLARIAVRLAKIDPIRVPFKIKLKDGTEVQGEGVISYKGNRPDQMQEVFTYEEIYKKTGEPMTPEELIAAVGDEETLKEAVTDALMKAHDPNF